MDNQEIMNNVAEAVVEEAKGGLSLQEMAVLGGCAFGCAALGYLGGHFHVVGKAGAFFRKVFMPKKKTEGVEVQIVGDEK